MLFTVSQAMVEKFNSLPSLRFITLLLMIMNNYLLIKLILIISISINQGKKRKEENICLSNPTYNVNIIHIQNGGLC